MTADTQNQGCSLSAYQDGDDIWRIGYGSIRPEINPGMTITQA